MVRKLKNAKQSSSRSANPMANQGERFIVLYLEKTNAIIPKDSKNS
jgi:hypothetical protein